MADTLITPPVGSLSFLGQTARVITIGLVLTGYAPTISDSSTTATIIPPSGSLSTERETFPTTSLLDAFTRADENPLASGPWQAFIGGTSRGKILSNALTHTLSTQLSNAWTTTPGADQEISCRVVTRPNAAGNVSLFVRATALNSFIENGYLCQFRLTTWTLATYVGGSIGTTLATGTYTLADGNDIGLSIRGTTLRVYHKPSAGAWTRLGSATDTTYATGTIGFYALDTATGTVLDDVGGGSFIPTNDAPVLLETRHVVRTPGVGVLTLSGYTPTIQSGINITLTPGTGTLVFGVTIDTTAAITPPVGSLTFTGNVGTAQRSQDPLSGTLTLTGYAPGVLSTVVQGTVLTPGTATLTLTGQQPLQNLRIAPPAGALACQANATIGWTANTEPDLAGYFVYHGTTTLTYTESINVGLVTIYIWNDLPYGANYFAVTAYDTAVPPNESVFSAEVSSVESGAGHAPTLTIGTPTGTDIPKQPPTGALVLTGLAPDIHQDFYIVPPTGTLTLTGYTHAVIIPTGALTLTGYAPTLLQVGPIDFQIIPPTGSLTLQGYAKILVESPLYATLTLTGYAPTVTEQGSFTIVPPPGSLVLYAPQPFNTAFARDANAIADAGGSPVDA